MDKISTVYEHIRKTNPPLAQLAERLTSTDLGHSSGKVKGLNNKKVLEDHQGQLKHKFEQALIRAKLQSEQPEIDISGNILHKEFLLRFKILFQS